MIEIANFTKQSISFTFRKKDQVLPQTCEVIIRVLPGLTPRELLQKASYHKMVFNIGWLETLQSGIDVK